MIIKKFFGKNVKKEVLNEFTILDKKSFWVKHLGENNIKNIFVFYKKFKLLLRFEIIKYQNVKRSSMKS